MTDKNKLLTETNRGSADIACIINEIMIRKRKQHHHFCIIPETPVNYFIFFISGYSLGW